MSVNLIRNSKVYFTTNLDPITKEVKSSGFLGGATPNTWRIEVMNGFSFSQNTTTETVTLNEAGAAPVRGQRSFNTALDPVEFSMSTYLRPAYIDAGTTDTITAAEKVLWNAFMGAGALGSGAWVETAGPAPTTKCTFINSNVHQLQAFGLVIVLDNVAYYIDNCALDTVTIDFGLDAIAMANWTGRGTKLRQEERPASPVAGTPFNLTAGTHFTDVPSNAQFIANKLSTTTIKSGIMGEPTGLTSGADGSPYTVAITGGSITMSNNLTYLTPEVLGVVNKPVTYFTGTRAISGELTAYLRSSGGVDKLTAELQKDILTTSDTAQETKFSVTVAIGGTSTHRVEISLPAAMLQVPNITTDQVVSTTIGFTAQGYSGDGSSAASAYNYDITSTNEASVSYFAIAAS